MIKVILDTQAYCEKCEAYEPVVKMERVHDAEQNCINMTIVYCKFKEHCRHLHTYFKEETVK